MIFKRANQNNKNAKVSPLSNHPCKELKGHPSPFFASHSGSIGACVTTHEKPACQQHGDLANTVGKDFIYNASVVSWRFPVFPSHISQAVRTSQ